MFALRAPQPGPREEGSGEPSRTARVVQQLNVAGLCLTDGNPGSRAVVHSLVEIMADTPSQMKGKVCKSCSPGDRTVGALHKPPK